ncbi:MOSC domain-containing protein [Fredinandcohnia sp. QZ13]|uniref:MOSC domain-containing protein n=1 Tax=Fredinandcohnia sp. QZ13 TaxID=3073144 RepID=UPI002852FBAF|nr:MOSC domain-containing protein [Fredinandcohnia sp. QZ13]MDR4888308.1 MOSC domain-containing protein [Fredinandcohnia sp. QZ13]
MGNVEKYPYIEQLFIGKPKTFGDPNAKKLMDKEWTSGIFKEPVHTPLWLGKENLEGDGQADLKNHGGPEKAVLAYAATHYEKWQSELENERIQAGAMGENFSIVGLDETNVCIGDIYEVGEALVQISQPRQPCWKPARRFKILDFALRIQKSGRTGWYFRVVKEGIVKRHDTIKLIERSYPEWSIARCNEIMHEKKDDLDSAAKLATCEHLAVNWKETLTKRLKGESKSIDSRVYGPNT